MDDIGFQDIGSLLWAKIGSHPYWPCMVSYDPNKGIFFNKVKGRYREINIYHVQYFGKTPTHGWTNGDIFLFKGGDEYLAKKDKAIKDASTESKKKKLKLKYHVPSSVSNEWLHAVTQAEKALKYRLPDRYELFVFKYDINFKEEKEKEMKKRKRKRKQKRVTKAPSSKPKPILTYATSIIEPLCNFCEKGSVDLACSSGICKRSYHKSCVGIINSLDNFLCSFCATDKKQPCIVCKYVGNNTEKCIKCDNFYHDYCLERFKCAELKKNICSAHVCWTCYVKNPRNGCSKGTLLTCFRCPTAFHDTPNCLPVGSVRLSPVYILCPEHFLGKNKLSLQSVNNANFCSSCYVGGELVCCESCPNAYHKACINGDVPLGDFFCDDCISRKYIYSQMLVWAKSGFHRWWPAQILNPEELPSNIKSLSRYDGEFPVLFFGSDEFAWSHRGKVFPYNEFNRNLKILRSKSGKENRQIEIKFNLSLEEVTQAYEELHKFKKFQDSKPAHFRHIRVNRAIPPAFIINQPQSSCTCSPSDENPCGPDSLCLNRSMFCECHADFCKAKSQCQNQRFQKREYAAVKVIKTENRGFGLQANQFIPEGTFVIEYVGEIITTNEYEKRANYMRNNGIQNYYFLYLDKGRLIDAGPSGNLARFINHSCNPNCVMEKWSVNGDMRIGIFAITDIKHGEELCFNYQSEVEFGQDCYCGASTCLGVIGRNGKKKRKLH